jgi:hypothetical protein
MADILLFWNAGPAVRLSPPEICRELTWGEEVHGLIDLRVKEILDRIKAAFPNHEERSGEFTGHGESGSFDATWTWQYIKVELHDLAEPDRQRLVEAVGLPAHDPQAA